ncbi:MAG TPA: YceD family protein [Verrucomicrobiae bacterium]|jgi:uncharacterized protein
MIKFNLRHLEEDEIHLKGESPAAELAFDVEDELIRVEKPLRYDLEIKSMHDAILVQGSLRLTLDCECARCLKPFKHEVALTDWALHLPLEGEDKVSIENDSIDLTPYVREDMLIEFPQHPLCKPECAGLKKKNEVRKAGELKNAEKPSAWTELDKLKL